MNETNSSPPSVSIPEQIHAKQRFWQVLFPLIVVCVLLSVGFALLLIYSGELGSSTEGLAAAALVAIALPLMLVFLVTLLLLVALITGASKVSAWLPGAGGEALKVFRIINAAAQNGSRALLSPLMSIGQKSAELGYLIDGLRSRHTKGNVR